MHVPGVYPRCGVLPSHARLTNQVLATRLGVTEDYIVKLTGIRERRRAAPEEATSDMAVLAAQAALEDAGLAPEGIDGVLVATATSDYVTPATANLVQRRLGLRPVPTYDLNVGCTGSLYALITASGLSVLDVQHHTGNRSGNRVTPGGSG